MDRSATGKVRDVRFFDRDVAQASLTAQHMYSTGPCRPAPNIQDIAKFRACRFVAIGRWCCGNGIIAVFACGTSFLVIYYRPASSVYVCDFLIL